MTYPPDKKITARELSLILDTDFLLTKARIMEKMEGLLSDTREQLRRTLQKTRANIPAKKTLADGKIFRGENYKLLPYMVLDYPRHFSKDSVFALRTMFWWGKEFSCTLHLQGEALEQFRDRLLKNAGNVPADAYICMNKSPWEYYFEKANYIKVKAAGKRKLKKTIAGKDFIKLSRRLELRHWKKLPSFAQESLAMYSKLLD